MCVRVCVFVCVSVRESEREEEIVLPTGQLKILSFVSRSIMFQSFSLSLPLYSHSIFWANKPNVHSKFSLSLTTLK